MYVLSSSGGEIIIMPHIKRKQGLTGDSAAGCMAEAVSIDVLANILGYLDSPKEIMQKRRVCKKWKEAVKITIVPLTDFCLNSLNEYNAMNVMTRAMPNLQQIMIGHLGYEHGHKFSDGEDPDERFAAFTADWTSHDIEIISNFSKLRRLDITQPPLNGRYPFLFNFPLLEKLRLNYCYNLKWDLEMLAGFPLLKELDCEYNYRLTGKIYSLRVLKDTLEKVTIRSCVNVQGNLMDLADFSQLKELNLHSTAVTGDIRDICEHDFTLLEQLGLPKSVYGAKGCEFQRISDAPDLMRAVYLLNKQRPALEYLLFEGYRWYGALSEDSPDYYERVWFEDEDSDAPPLYIRSVQVGSRIGYRWETEYEDAIRGSPCEVNWLDPEPDRESSEYGRYIEELQVFQRQVGLYRGFHQPPTEEEYNRLHNL